MHSVTSIAEAPTLGELAYRNRSAFTDRFNDSYMCLDSIPRPRVLCFSRDRVLGESRRLVLQRRYDAVYVGSIEELAAWTSGSPFDAIVLCHTLSVQDRERCLRITASLWPRAKIISVASQIDGQQSEFSDVVLGLDGPRALLRTVQQVLQPTDDRFGERNELR